MSNKLLTVFNGATAAFTPASISGLVAWYDFSDAATLFTDSARTTPVTADGDAIGGVTDKSTSGLSLGSSGTARPLYKASIQNSKSMVLYDDTDDSLSAANVLGSRLFSTNQCAIYIVQKYVSGNTRGVFWKTTVDIVNTHLPYTTKIYFDFKDAIPGRVSANTPAAWTSTKIVEMHRAADGTQEIITNGASSVSAVTTTTLDTTRSGTLYIGGGDGIFGALYYGEIYIYKTAHDATNRALVRGYLNAKWAVY